MDPQAAPTCGYAPDDSTASSLSTSADVTGSGAQAATMGNVAAQGGETGAAPAATMCPSHGRPPKAPKQVNQMLRQPDPPPLPLLPPWRRRRSFLSPALRPRLLRLRACGHQAPPWWPLQHQASHPSPAAASLSPPAVASGRICKPAVGSTGTSSATRCWFVLVT